MCLFLVFHACRDKSRQCIFFTCTNLLKYQPLTPFQWPQPPSTSQSGQTRTNWFNTGGFYHGENQGIRWATVYLCCSSATTVHWCEDRPGNNLLSFFLSVIFNVFLSHWVFPTPLSLIVILTWRGFMQWLCQEPAWWISLSWWCCALLQLNHRRKDLTWKLEHSSAVIWLWLTELNPWLLHHSCSLGKIGSHFSSVLHAVVPSNCHQVWISSEMVYIWSNWVRDLFAYLFILYKAYVSWTSEEQSTFSPLTKVTTGTSTVTHEKWDIDLFIIYAKAIVCTRLCL